MEEKDTDIVPIQIKLERGLRKKFKDKCKVKDIHYAQWVRGKIKEFVEDKK
jgi:hypothetical protein